MAQIGWIAVLVAGVLCGAVLPARGGGAGPADPDVAAVARANDEFAFDLYGRLRAQPGNVFFSGYSISNALTMTYAGAGGATAAEMAKALRLPFEGERLHRAYAAVNRDVNGDGAKRRAELSVANALWIQAGLPTRPAFTATVKNLYGAALTPLDFQRAPERARIAINAWVEQQTRERIKDLVPEGTIRPDTRVVLTNAIYFKGTWKHAFPEAATRNEAFWVAEGKSAGTVPLMRQMGKFRYLDGGSFQALELPYDADEQSLIVLLPRRAEGLADLEQALTSAQMTAWLGRMSVENVDVALPRFKVTAQFQLKDTLAALGMPLAFSPGAADFSGITTAQPLALSAVIHKAYVDVNEKGTEAAAATGAVVMATSARAPEPIVVFRADHPFVFVIRDNRTGTVLFAGRLANPQAG